MQNVDVNFCVRECVWRDRQGLWEEVKAMEYMWYERRGTTYRGGGPGKEGHTHKHTHMHDNVITELTALYTNLKM